MTTNTWSNTVLFGNKIEQGTKTQIKKWPLEISWHDSNLGTEDSDSDVDNIEFMCIVDSDQKGMKKKKNQANIR